MEELTKEIVIENVIRSILIIGNIPKLCSFNCPHRMDEISCGLTGGETLIIEKGAHGVNFLLRTEACLILKPIEETK